jgi:acetylglutamate kinase
VRKDDRIGNYSPAFKRALLVQALGYISRFRGTRCVIHSGGAALVRDGLRRALCDDVLLLHSVGLSPIVALGSGSSAELLTILNRAGGVAVGLSGRDAALLRARKRPTESMNEGAGGGSAGPTGELVEVNKAFLESLIGQHYIPVISPVGIGTDGDSYHLDGDVVAAGVARAIGADKLMYLADVPGIVEAGELVTDLTPATLRGKITAGVITNGTAGTATAALAALAGGVRAVHLIDGRIPHNIIAELFTDTGVGTIVRAE